LHRVVVGLFIMASSALCFYFCRKESGSRVDSFTAAALVYAGLLYYSTPIASPNSLGLFLFLSAIIVPWLYDFSTRSLAASLALGILAFYTKQYFIACLGYVALYLFLAVSKKRAVYFGVAALATAIVVFALVCFTSPYYLEDTFFSVLVSQSLTASDELVVTQFREFIQIYLPLLIIFPIAILHTWHSNKRVTGAYGQQSRSTAFFNLTNFDKPLLFHKLNYVWLCCACSVTIIALLLGKNRGNHLTYLFQLISPFFLVGLFALISTMPKWRWLTAPLVVIGLYNSYAMLQKDFSVDEENWRIVRKEVAQANDIYASTLVLREILEKGAPVYQNGHSRYFIFGQSKWPLFVKSDPDLRVTAVWDRYVEYIQSKIRNQEFDLLLIDQGMYPLPTAWTKSAVDTQTLLMDHYKRTATIMLPLSKRLGGGTQAVEIWKRMPATSNAGEPQ
jgi:hypothetical protein